MEKSTKKIIVSLPPQHMYTERTIKYAKKRFHKILLLLLVSLFGPTVVCVFQTGLTACQSFLFCGPTSNLFQTFSGRELKCNWRGAGKGKKTVWVSDPQWQQRDELLAAGLEGVFLKIWSSMIDCILSAKKI